MCVISMADDKGPMYAIFAHAKVKPECCEAWETSFKAQAETCYANEPGLLLYQMTKDPKNKGDYTVMELYQGRDALQSHGKYVATIRDPARESYLVSPLEPTIMPVVGMIPPKLDQLDSKEHLCLVTGMPAQAKHADDFEKAFLQGLPDVEKEPGALFYALAKHRKQEGMYYVLEIFKDDAASDYHVKGPWMVEAVRRWRGPNYKEDPYMVGRPPANLTTIRRVSCSKSHAKASKGSTAAKL